VAFPVTFEEGEGAGKRWFSRGGGHRYRVGPRL